MSSANNQYITSIKEMVALSFLGVIGNISPFILPIIIGALVDHVGMSIQDASYVASADMFGLGLGTLIWSKFILSANWRKFALLSALMLFTGNLLCAFSETLVTAAASRFLAGTGGGLMLVIGVSGLSNTKNPDRIVALYMLLVTAVASLVLYSFPYLIAATGAKGMFLTMAGFTGLALISSYFVPKKSVSTNNISANDQENAGSIRSSNPVRWMAVCGVLTSFFGLSLFWVYIERVGVAGGLITSQISSGLGTAQFFGVPGAIAAAVVATRFGRMFPVMLAMGLTLMASLIIPASPEFTLFVIAASSTIFAWNWFYPYVVGVMVSLDATAKLVTYALVMMTLGKSLSPLVGSFFVTETDYSAAYWLCVISFAVSVVLFIPALRLTDSYLGSAKE